MPISVEIKVNGRLIDALHIARLTGRTRPDSVNEYSIVRASQLPGATQNPYARQPVLPEPQSDEEWLAGVKFEHVYGDGIEVCVMKGVAALEADDGTRLATAAN